MTEPTNMSSERRKVPPEDQIGPSEAFCWATGELAKTMAMREAMEIATVAIKSSTEYGDGSWSPYDEDIKELRELARTMIGKANDIYRCRLADWFARMEVSQTLNPDSVMPPPGQTLRKVRELAMDALDEQIRLHLVYQEKLGGPWTGEPHRTIVDRMLRAVRLGDRGLSSTQAVIGRPQDRDSALAKAAQAVASDAVEGKDG